MVPATINRLLLRGAIRIHDALAIAGRESVPNLPETAWHELQLAHKRLKLAVNRTWTYAAVPIRRDIEHSLSYLIRQLDDCRRNVGAEHGAGGFSSRSDVHRELVALETEFDEVRLDLKARTLAVVTHSIVLEHVNLGGFKIVLHWDRLDEDDAYEVIALDPHPTAGDSSTTHPHVRDERLCEGDGRIAIRRALAQGRLCDFFVLVRLVLETYNPSSAFVSLEHWSGTPCQDCGRMTDEDDSTSCERCADNLCLDCCGSCQECGRSVCSDCRAACSGCDQDFCAGCLQRCRGEFCANGQRSGDCPACQERDKQSHDQIDSSAGSQTIAGEQSSNTPLQSLRMGETLVPA